METTNAFVHWVEKYLSSEYTEKIKHERIRIFLNLSFFFYYRNESESRGSNERWNFSPLKGDARHSIVSIDSVPTTID